MSDEERGCSNPELIPSFVMMWAAAPEKSVWGGQPRDCVINIGVVLFVRFAKNYQGF